MELVLGSMLLRNVEIVITLFVFIWIYSWAKNNLGSAKLGVLFALIVIYLTLYMFPILVWTLIILFLLATFGTEIADKLNIYKE